MVYAKYLRKLASRGIPDEGSQRGVVWRLLLGYLPPETEQWQDKMTEARAFYKACTADLFADTWDTEHGDSLRWRPRRRGPSRPSSCASLNDINDIDNDNDKDHTDNTDNSQGSTASSLEDVDLPMMQDSPFARPAPVTPEIPNSILEAWKNRGKDEHLLLNLMMSYNALKINPLAAGKPDGTQEEEPPDPAVPADEDDAWTRAAKDFCESGVLLDEIRKDVFRTHPDLAFFLDPVDDLGRRRYYALERILFVWATYNKGVRYVQGTCVCVLCV